MVSAYIFSSDPGSYVPNPELLDNADKLSDLGETTALTVDELDQLYNDDTTGGGDLLYPPDTFTIDQVLRNNADGSTSIDIVVSIPDENDFQYEVRVSRS